MHSHDVRNGQDYFGQRVCVVGTSYSAEDIASMAWKNGCKSVIACSRGNAMVYDFPENFHKKPMIKNCNEKTLTFEDGTTAEADVIIMCTGYTHNVPFMEDKLRLNTETSLYIDKAYKSMFWQTNPNLMYTGMVNQCYTFTMFDSQAWYCRDVILGKIALPSAEDRQADIDKWMKRMTTMEITYPNLIGFQGDYITDLNDNTDYPKIDTEHMLGLFLDWIKNKQADIMTFRDK